MKVQIIINNTAPPTDPRSSLLPIPSSACPFSNPPVSYFYHVTMSHLFRLVLAFSFFSQLCPEQLWLISPLLHLPSPFSATNLWFCLFNTQRRFDSGTAFLRCDARRFLMAGQQRLREERGRLGPVSGWIRRVDLQYGSKSVTSCLEF